ncbi:aminotransferase class V-fold PLP-dependent enzyme, partial [Actinocorallia lasiicapitis]
SKHVGECGTVEWASDAEQRHEAGTPNVLGAIALAAACSALTGWDEIVAEERRLLARLRSGLAGIPAVRELSLWGPGHPRVGIVSFTVEGHPARQVAEYLSQEHGIGVRDGKFCAHPLVKRLVGEGTGGCENADGTAVRASIGIGTTDEHVDRLVTALRGLAG